MIIKNIDPFKQISAVVRRNLYSAAIIAILIIASLAGCSRHSCPNSPPRDLPFIEYSFKNKR